MDTTTMSVDNDTDIKTPLTPSMEDGYTGTRPGLLRLPLEIRLQIYDSLVTNSYTTPVYRTGPHICSIWTSPKLFKLPVMQVCRQLRYETIPIFYDRSWWTIDFSLSSDTTMEWLNAVEPYALQCMEGIILRGFRHVCSKGCAGWAERIEVDFVGGKVNVTSDHKEVLDACPAKESERQRRAFLANWYGKEIERDRTSTKEMVLEMVKRIEAVDRQ